MSAKLSFLAELKRRHVYKVAIAYVVAAWLLLQLGSILFPALNAPAWSIRLLIGFLVIGFPIAILLAWAFEVTPEGVRRTESAQSDEAWPTGHAHKIGRHLNSAIIVVLMAAVAVLAWRQFFYQPPAQFATKAASAELVPAAAGKSAKPAATIPAKSIAVLPFENLSADKNNAYFASGIQDLILTKLADVGDLKVISRTSTEKYKSRPADLKTVAQQLGVATILEGSVQKAGKQVLINVQLIDAATDSHIWAKAYTRTLNNIFGVEGEVAEKIAQALKAELTPAETARVVDKPTENAKAYDAFLRAEYVLHKSFVGGNADTGKRALPLYKKAVAADPAFALAWARLSFLQANLAIVGGVGISPRQLWAEAAASAGNALKLNPDLAEAYIAEGFIALWRNADHAGARKSFEKALHLKPSDTDAMKAMAMLLNAESQPNAAIGWLQKALAHDPRNTLLATLLGATYISVRRYADAESLLQRALALDSSNVNARIDYARLIVITGGDPAYALTRVQGDAPQLKHARVALLYLERQYRKAILLLKSVPYTPGNFSVFAGSKALAMARLYELSGDTVHAKTLYAQALRQAQAQLKVQVGAYSHSLLWSSIASAEMGLGDEKAAFAAIRRSLKLSPQSMEHWVQLQGAEIYAKAGRADLAVPLLARIFSAPDSGALTSPAIIKLNPVWDPIRNDPRFQALLSQYPVGAT